jgi:hypothetical protein
MAKIKKVNVLSLAKIQAVIGLILGIIAGIFFGLVASLLGMSEGASGFLLGAGMGIFSLIAFPIFYGVAGFIGGAILAFLYNLVASKIGGLEIELED